MDGYCQPGQRDRVYRAAHAVAELHTVIAATPVAAAKSRSGQWALHLLCRHDSRGLPPAVANALAGYDLRVRDVHQREYWHVTATA
jgi:hypothetical protein